MDRHEFVRVSAEEAALAHPKDLSEESDTGGGR
jgi:hypothetical protein